MKKIFFLTLFLFSIKTLAADIEGTSVLLRGVDKITGRTNTTEIEVGIPTTIGDIRITLERCLKAPPEETPENSAFFFMEEITGETANVIFNGWMFSSNPALSAMEHPIYDIWVLECNVEETALTTWENIPSSKTMYPTLSNDIKIDELMDI